MEQYIVYPGDTLVSIAARYGQTWRYLYTINPQIANPDVIYPGQMINVGLLTPSTVNNIHFVEQGEALWSIGLRYGVTARQILVANPFIKNPDFLYPGLPLLIPVATPSFSSLEYTIMAGDTLSQIAARYSTNPYMLLRLNPSIPVTGAINSGQRIYVPLPISQAEPGCLIFAFSSGRWGEIWLSDTTGRKQTRLVAFTPGWNPYNIKWSPDGKHITFILYHGEGEKVSLYKMGPCGENMLQLAEGQELSYSWSSDSSRIAYANENGLYIITPEGTSQKILGKELGQIRNPSWFPGNTRIAGENILHPEEQIGELFTVDATGQNFKRLTEVPANSMRLSPDGRYAASAYSPDYPTGIIYEFTSGKITTLKVDAGDIADWSPDSNKILYNGMNGNAYIAATNGNILNRLGRAYAQIWGPASDLILVYDGFARFLIINMSTGQRIRLTNTGESSTSSWKLGICPQCQV